MPTNLGTEAYYVFVITDPARYNATGALFEVDERNNARGSTDPVLIDQPPPTDIRVDNIVVPASAEPGDPVTVRWTVENTSAVTANGSWTDAVYLSADATWDINDTLLGYGDFSGSLTTGQTYTRELTTSLPGTAAGDYRVIVRTDARNQLAEDTGDANNTTASASAISVSVDALTLGVPLTVGPQTGAGAASTASSCPQAKRCACACPRTTNARSTKSSSATMPRPPRRSSTQPPPPPPPTPARSRRN